MLVALQQDCDKRIDVHHWICARHLWYHQKDRMDGGTLEECSTKAEQHFQRHPRVPDLSPGYRDISAETEQLTRAHSIAVKVSMC